MNQVRRHPALLLLSAFVGASVAFIACSGDPYGDEWESQVSGNGKPEKCIPGTVRRCRGPRGCLGEQKCLPSGDQYGPCVCTMNPPKDASSCDGKSCAGDALSSNDAAGDAPSSNDAADDAPSSNDAAGDAPSSNDAADDAPSSNGSGGVELPDLAP